ncbi:MAG: phosphatase PAP2 family protein [Ruminococcus sp.]|nr:phosphatase PAP2 family protein [Ruminococcus sp.]
MFENITQIDFDILYWIQDNLKNAFLDVLMPFFSIAEEGGVIWIALAIGLICFKKTRYCGIAILLAMAVDTIICEGIIKNIVCRVRPCNQVDDLVMLVSKPQSYGFPSNHSASSFAAATAFAINIRKKLWAIPVFLLATIVAVSRLYNFVHFPSDVLVGTILGILIAVIVCYIMDKSGFKAFLQRKNVIVSE